MMAVALLLAAGTLIQQHTIDSTDMLVWILVLSTLSTPYLAAVILSFISAFTKLPASLVHGTSTPPQPGTTVLDAVKSGPTAKESR
jgi:hypothetical protein